MKVLLTGSDTVLGGNIARQLSAGGFNLKVLLEPDAEPPALEGLEFERVEGTVMDPESTAKSISRCHAVFHCDPRVSLKPPRSRLVYGRNIEGTRNILVGMTRAGVENLIYVGSATSFGYGTALEPGTEESSYNSGGFRLDSLDSLAAAQALVVRYAREGRVRGIVVNPTVTLGPFDSAGSPGWTLIECVSSGLKRYPPGGVNVVGARDAARASIKALGRGRPGRCYILGGYNLTYRELTGIIARDMGMAAPDRQWGSRRLRIAGTLRSAAGMAAGPGALSAELARISTSELYYSSDRAEAELDLTRDSLDGIVDSACSWFGQIS